MKYTLAWICLFFFLSGVFITAQPTKDLERGWPPEISEENTKFLFTKFKEGLIPYQKKQRKITLDQVNGKSVYGIIESIDLEKCTILDSKNQKNIVFFKKIRGSNFFKFVEDKNHNDQMLLTFGIIFLYDKKWDRAELCFQRSINLGNENAKGWLAKAKAEIEKNTPKEIAIVSEKEEIKETSKTEELSKPKEPITKPTPEKVDPKTATSLLPPPLKNLPKLGIPKIDSIKATKKIDFSQHVFPGYYTIFEFFSPTCAACEQVGPQIEETCKNRSELILRKIDIGSSGGPVVNQLKIKSIPFFVIYGPTGIELMRGDYKMLIPYLKQWLKK